MPRSWRGGKVTKQRQHANVGGGEPPELCGAPVRQLHGAWHERARVVHCRGGESRLDAQGRPSRLLQSSAAPGSSSGVFVCAPSVVAGRPAGRRSVLLNNSVRALGWAGVRQPGRRGVGPRLPARRLAGRQPGLRAGLPARQPGLHYPLAGAGQPGCRAGSRALGRRSRGARPPAAKLPGPRQPGCPAPGSRAARPPAAGLPSRQPGCPACRYETHVRHGETGQNQVSTRAPGVVALLNCGISHCAASSRDCLI